MRSIWLCLGLAVLLGFVLPAPAWAGEVTLVGGDVLHGRTWKDDGILHIDHPALGLIQLKPQHYASATLDEEDAAIDPVTAALGVRPVLCRPPAEVDPAVAPACPSPFDFSIGAGMAIDGGNTDKQQFNLDADAEYRWRNRSTLTFRTTNFYERANGVQTEGKYFASLRYQRDLTARTYLFGLWLAQRDDFSDIELRTGWQVGVGHYLMKREKQQLRAEIGGGFTVEQRKDQPRLETPSAYAGAIYRNEFGAGDYVEAHAWTVQYLDSRGLSPYQLQLRYGHPIREHLDITASFLLDYVADPPAGIRSTDTKFVLGLRWRPTKKSK